VWLLQLNKFILLRGLWFWFVVLVCGFGLWFWFVVLVCGSGFIAVVHLAENFPRTARKVSSHFEYLKNRSRGLDVT